MHLLYKEKHSKYMEVKSIIERWSRRYGEEVLKAMMYLPMISELNEMDDIAITEWIQQLESHLSISNGSGPRFHVRCDNVVEEDKTLVVTKDHNGLTATSIIHQGFFGSSEYKSIAMIGAELKDLLEPGAYLTRGKQRAEPTTFPEAIDWLMDQAKQSQNIQRYKGLGEMNPDQLWDTTVNPETRRLIQVRIEDAVGADEIFTTLMGDNVEPRREFIERNALSASNLDV
jgi:DNA gyrase subunit B